MMFHRGSEEKYGVQGYFLIMENCMELRMEVYYETLALSILVNARKHGIFPDYNLVLAYLSGP